MNVLLFITRNKFYTKGFTLVELMIVVAIVAIIAAIAYPSYSDQVRKTRRAEGKAELLEIMQAQERLYSIANTYTTNLTDPGLDYLTANNVPSENGYYLVTAVACGAIPLTQCINLTATPPAGGVQVNDGCGVLSIDSRGNEGATGPLPVADCW